MIIESTVMISEWLKHDTHGVNVLIDSVKRRKPGPIPRGESPSTWLWPRPKDVNIYDDVQDTSVAMELEPEKVPALVVFCDSDARVDTKPGPIPSGKAGGIVIVVSYIVRNVEPLIARRDGGFILRTVVKSLNRFNDPKISERYRVLNDIQVVKIDSIRVQRVAGSVGRSTLAGFVLATLDVLDRAP